MKKILFTLFFVFSASLQYSIADENDDFVKQVFTELDVNRDGIIDKNDIQKFSKKEFKLMDKNKDGVISKEEFFEFVCEKSCKQGNCECKSHANKENLDYLKEYWERTDKNGDGQITFQEKLDGDLDNFYSLDSNSNEKITKEEIEAQLY